jgi:hypothetical protein
LFIIIAGIVSLLYFYCSKCTCGREDCSHFFIGKLLRFFPDRRGSGYSLTDYIGTIIPLALMIGLPQYILIKFPVLMIVFWILMLAGGMLILLFVCKNCRNKNCKFCPAFIKRKGGLK